MYKLNTLKIFSLLSLLVILFACDTSDGNVGTGSLSLDITDAPIDSAAKVVVAFSGVSIKPENGPAFDIDFFDINSQPETKFIDLLNQQGFNSAPLLVDYVLPAGNYQWMRLKVITSKTTTDSYLELDDGSQHPLYIPSGDETGLKLNRGFNITNGGAVGITIDFDLRKSVVLPENGSEAYKLKPSLRMIDNNTIGHIYGSVGAATLNDINCTGTEYAVYAFAGDNIVPDDVDDIDPEPVTTSLLSNSFEYALGFLEPGVYTLAFTCQANDDNNETDDAIVFFATDSVLVETGTATLYNFN